MAGAKNHGFLAGSCQQEKTIRPPTLKWALTLLNAVCGSSKNMTPNWLSTKSNGPPETVPICMSTTQMVTFWVPASPALFVANAANGADRSAPTTTPAGTYQLRYHNRGLATPTPNIKHPLTGLGSCRFQNKRRDRVGQPLTSRPNTRPLLVVPPPPLKLVSLHTDPRLSRSQVTRA